LFVSVVPRGGEPRHEPPGAVARMNPGRRATRPSQAGAEEPHTRTTTTIMRFPEKGGFDVGRCLKSGTLPCPGDRHPNGMTRRGPVKAH
jgi:hypothetical protein